MEFTPTEEYRKFIADYYGRDGAEWLESINDTIGLAEKRWGIEVTETVAAGFALVLKAKTPTGASVHLKLFPEESIFAHQKAALDLYQGNGSVGLLAADEETKTLMMKSLDGTPPPPEHEAQAVAEIMKKLHSAPIPPEQAKELTPLEAYLGVIYTASPEIPQEFAGVAEKARYLLKRLLETTNPEDVVALHADLHPSNIIGTPGNWVSIDPAGVSGDRNFDFARFMIGPETALVDSPDPKKMLDDRLSHAVNQGYDPERIKQWAFVCAAAMIIWTYGKPDSHFENRLRIAQITADYAGIGL